MTSLNGGARLASAAATSIIANSSTNLTKSPALKRATKNISNSTAKGFTTVTGTTTRAGGFHPEPKKLPMGLAGITGTISTGLLVGAGISKNIASFLEENELFVPSDDDDDD